MNCCDQLAERADTSASCVALFDERGALQGATTAFLVGWSQTPDASGTLTIADFLPELDAHRWAAIWQRLHTGAVETLRLRRPVGDGSQPHIVDVEICKFIGKDGHHAKVEVDVADGAKARLRLLQQLMLEAMAAGVPLLEVMDLLCRQAEQLAPSVICSVLSVDHRGCLHHLASPSLPKEYAVAIDGVSIGPKAGSCGTAAYRGEPVVVTDIATDPLWDDFKSLALPLGLRACWSSPIKSSGGRVLGAFAFYFSTPRGPSLIEQQIVATCLHLCAIALEHEETRSRVYELAYLDPLSGLSNRNRFKCKVNDALRVVRETKQSLAIHYLGLDYFKSVNDDHGYATGDDYLRAVAGRLQSAVQDPDLVARISGDEFAIIQIGDHRAQDIADFARKLIDVVAQPHDLGGEELKLGTSVGIAIAPNDGETADELITNAAWTLRRVKELGRGSYFFYDKELNARMEARRKLETRLREALAADEFELHFQPIYDLETMQIGSAEALLRWGDVPPSEFIPVAEDSGLIVPIGEWVLRTACQAAAEWPGHIPVAVNLSPVQFEESGLVQVVARALAESGLDASRLELEVTENLFIDDSHTANAILEQLKDLGVTIALDDFGTGYSSLSYLQRFWFDRIKIDQAFVGRINRDEGSLKIVRTIVMLAHSLGLAVTAEGVETDEQFAAIRGEGCDCVQGFYTGRPLPLSVFERLVNGEQAATERARQRGDAAKAAG
jgi:diguanylate cyclase (GGDEF)-like protein